MYKYNTTFNMKHIAQFVVLFCFCTHRVHLAKLPGPLVYVVTPSSNLAPTNTGRASPFYYRNWIRRMDTMDTKASSTTTTARTPDLIFAEFESGNNNMKSIRKLLDKEKIQSKITTTSTSRPIYVPDEEISAAESNLPQTKSEKPENIDMTDYFALYNNLHNSSTIYVPSAPSLRVTFVPTSTPISTTTTQKMVNNVENIWHIIDNHKHEQYADGWEEATLNDTPSVDNNQKDETISHHNQAREEDSIDDNFALPGFGTNPGNDAENESRAIRNEPNIRFPYINLKPFKMKNINSKKANNILNSNTVTETKYPSRGEVQDIHTVAIRPSIDRYNPAQPYLPTYGTKQKQSSGNPTTAAPTPLPQTPIRAFANLVPPPPPPAPQITADDFPTPSIYESFPPYVPGGQGTGSTFSFPPSMASGSDSSTDDADSPPSGYKLEPAPQVNQAPVHSPRKPPSSSFIPTLPPLSKPFSGYTYNKPPMVQEDIVPTMDINDKPNFQGYHYSKPSPPPSPPQAPSLPQNDYSAPSYGHHDVPVPSFHSEPDYPELVFDKPQIMGDMNGDDTGKENDMGMMPPPLPDTKPNSFVPSVNDQGFPYDFPGDFKYSHDFDDHDYHHHYHHTTTTTTTEQPRVNRYSYYYLGKKLYYLPLYFSVYFIIYVGALIIKAVLRHKITYPNSFRPNDKTASFFAKRSIESHLSNDNLHEITGTVMKAITTAAEKYISGKSKKD